MPAIIAFPLFSIILALSVGFVVLHSRGKGFFLAVRNILLLCVGIWVATQAVSRIFRLAPSQQPTFASSGELTQARSRIADLQKQLAEVRAEIGSLQQQRAATTTPAPTESGAPISWNGSFGFVQGTDASGDAIFSAVVFSGTNAGSMPVQLKDAYIVSGLTGAKETLQVNLRAGPGQLAAIGQINQIPPNARIEL